jgi:YcaO-like protein with predicted kinase domain
VERLARVRGSRYHRHFPILWIQGCDLVSGTGVWLPFETVHVSAAVPQPSGSGCFAATSNGLASGNHLLEAIVHALLEVIERDATAVWGARPPDIREQSVVDLRTVNDPDCLSAIQLMQRAGHDPAVHETTSDTGIPSYLCEMREAHTDPERTPVFSGLGCHLDRGIALLRALTEAAQSRLTLIAGSRDDLSRRDYDERGHPPPPAAFRTFDSARARAGRTFNEDFERIRDRLLSVGVEQIVAVDLTLPEFGIPVVRVVVPGLEGPDDDPDYLPGPRADAARMAA